MRIILLITVLSFLAFAAAPVLAGKNTAGKGSDAPKAKNTPGALLFNFSSEPSPGSGRRRVKGKHRTKSR